MGFKFAGCKFSEVRSIARQSGLETERKIKKTLYFLSDFIDFVV
jgi:hypothetical protein